MSLSAATSSAVREPRSLSRYELKIASLRDLFDDPELKVESDSILTRGRIFPIVDEVVILLPTAQISQHLANQIAGASSGSSPTTRGYELSREVQDSFGQEWTRFPKILPEHEKEFAQYFDLTASLSMRDWRIFDLGCGIGRWSYFLSKSCREIVLVDFSEAIFVARQNLAKSDNALFFMGDIMNLPFRNNSADFAICLGVLHHLPIEALRAVRAISRLSSRLLIYLYYSLDNRPTWYRAIWRVSDLVRKVASSIKSPLLRALLCWIFALVGYVPFVLLGKLLAPLGLAKNLPNFEAHKNDSMGRIRQDCYDRFFTTIEQRVSRSQIMTLKDTFSSVEVSENAPYWHFLCSRDT